MTNNLGRETSPYLLQHANQPLDWQAWNATTLARAKAEDRPLFVSIGYASCHWCHVMAHETFDDKEVADELKDTFISIKVDREERPDIDAIYMVAATAMTGQGGWPLNVFCTPEGKPFYAGTYFPPTDRHGMPSFRKVVGIVKEAWATRRAEVEAQADSLLEGIEKETSLTEHLQGQIEGDLTSLGCGMDLKLVDSLLALIAQLEDRYDPIFGGFGPAPKFPRPTLIEVCLRHHLATTDQNSLSMATHTLDAMASGGIYDHLCGGFARYSTDRDWLVPHFEKMLTDQALLARTYLHAYQVTKNENYSQVAKETLNFILDELELQSGGFASSLDADADGEEGGHVVFSLEEVREAFVEATRPDLFDPVCEWYQITEKGNFEDMNIFSRPLGALLKRDQNIEDGRMILVANRKRRCQPGRDTKVLCEWNAMATVALAEAGRAFGTKRFINAAVRSGELLFSTFRNTEGLWLRSKGGSTIGFASDHAWVILAFLSLGELQGKAHWIDKARVAADILCEQFLDPLGHGVFTSSKDADRLIVRAKDWMDGAAPSANAASAIALMRLAMVTNEDAYRDGALQIINEAVVLLAHHPMAVADLVAALALLERGQEIVIGEKRQDFVEQVAMKWLPDAVVLWGERTSSPLWQDRRDDEAYVCRGQVCLQPCKDATTLATQLDGT